MTMVYRRGDAVKKQDFNTGWTCRPVQGTAPAIPVILSHDAMRTEQRTAASLGAENIGWFEGLDYLYEKLFVIPPEIREQHLELEFEGVYHDPEITVNGQSVPAPPYGYTDFSISLDGLVNPDGENTITVTAHNSD